MSALPDSSHHHSAMRRVRGHIRSVDALTWETAKWADGPALYRWMLAHIEFRRLHVCGVGQQVSKWQSGGKVSIWGVDRVFVPLGLHVAQLPDEVWIG